MKIAMIQMMTPPDKETAMEIVSKACEKAAESGADLVTLPEMFCCPYDTASFPVYAEAEGGTLWSALSETARKNHVYLSAGTMPEKDDSGKIYNTAYVFDREGNRIARHRKAHLFDVEFKDGNSFRESDTLSAGNEVTVFETEFGKMGLCICYDTRFPEFTRLMALRGARLILAPAAFNMTTGPVHWELTYRAQAVFNQVFMIGTASARDLEASYHSWGHSIAVDPWGEILCQMDEKEGTSEVQIDFARVEEVRSQLPLTRHRRTDIYRLEERKKRS